ncbi:MAG TPA: type II toxin-antitoxin system PemK/MazF family toxin [Candidatus Acidoferrum sp.]|jgi:mRNA interferase MazF|nr:type II toxin-antitoxin system PemK/MazF family toxin [Candidatus Acidoferrum sp.]
MTTASIRRGDVWLARLDKIRPLVVLTRDPLASILNAVIAAPITSTVRNLSTEVAVGPGDGVRVSSVANLDNVQLVARSRLVRRVGRVKPTTMRAICDALATAVDCG